MVAVQTHHRAEGAELEPAHQELAEGRIARVATGEAADVGGELRDADDAHVDARGDLVPVVGEGGVDVARLDNAPSELYRRGISREGDERAGGARQRAGG